MIQDDVRVFKKTIVEEVLVILEDGIETALYHLILMAYKTLRFTR